MRTIFGFELQRFWTPYAPSLFFFSFCAHDDITPILVPCAYAFVFLNNWTRIVFTLNSMIHSFSFNCFSVSGRNNESKKKNSYEIIGMSSIINNRLQHHSHSVHNHINYSIVNLCYLLSIFSHIILFAYTFSQIRLKWDGFVWIVPLILNRPTFQAQEDIFSVFVIHSEH